MALEQANEIIKKIIKMCEVETPRDCLLNIHPFVDFGEYPRIEHVRTASDDWLPYRLQ